MLVETFVVGDRVKVVGGQYFRKRGEAILATVTKISSAKRVWIRFDREQKSRLSVLRTETYLSPNSLSKLTPSPPVSTLETSSTLDSRSELALETKLKIRDLCRDFQAMGLRSHSLTMFAYMQVGMRELEE